MIVTDLNHIEHQVSMTLDLKNALAFLRRQDVHALPDGKAEIDGDRVYAIIQRYETIRTDSPKFEFHRKYIDVQFIASGEETIGWAPVESMMITEAYNADKDICFGKVSSETWTPVRLHAGQLAVLWPEDAHAPKLASDLPSPAMKVVVKIAV
jgi:biofilm protein TabA